MSTIDQYRASLECLRDLKVWDHEIRAKHNFVPGSPLTTLMLPLDEGNQYLGHLYRLIDTLDKTSLGSKGSRKFALLCCSHPPERLRWRFDSTKVRNYQRFTGKLVAEAQTAEQWFGATLLDELDNVLATELTDLDILRFKVLF